MAQNALLVSSASSSSLLHPKTMSREMVAYIRRNAEEAFQISTYLLLLQEPPHVTCPRRGAIEAELRNGLHLQDEVRALGRLPALNVPESFIARHPFPGRPCSAFSRSSSLQSSTFFSPWSIPCPTLCTSSDKAGKHSFCNIILHMTFNRCLSLAELLNANTYV